MRTVVQMRGVVLFTAIIIIDRGRKVGKKSSHTPLDATIALNRKIADLLRKQVGKTGAELKAKGK
tara:strand:- start:99 stop:293 length:195 start_codon:yes stop_codon:yes gene_type:complete